MFKFRNEVMKKVLIIEDSVMDRKLFVKALEKDEYEILEMENAEGVDSKLSISEPDLIILDMHLPGITGFDLVRKIEEQTVTPVLCVSSVLRTKLV